MEENKDDGVVIAENDRVDHLKPIKDVIEKAGIKMPEMVATGDLSVDSKEDIVIIDSVEDVDKLKEKVVKKLNKKDIPLPEMHDIFMHKGHEYKIVYINDGQHRFTCEPHKGDY